MAYSNAKPFTHDFDSSQPHEVRPPGLEEKPDHHCCCCDHDVCYEPEAQSSSGGILGWLVAFAFGFWFGGGFGDE